MTLARRWNDFWFTPEPALPLELCRVTFFGGLLYEHRAIQAWQWGEIDPVFWFPTPIFRALGTGIPSVSVLVACTVAYKLALLCACLGLLTRIATCVAFASGAFLLAVPHNFGKVHHSDAMLVFLLGALALSRVGSHYSVDAWLRRRFPRFPTFGAEPAAISGEYRWPIRFGWVASVIIYFAAGIAKLRESGLAWATATNFHNLLLRHHYTHEPKVMWGLGLAGLPLVCGALAKLTLVGELSAPLALFDVRLRCLIVPALISMQLGIYLLLGVTFRAFLLLIPFWIPWDVLAKPFIRAAR